MLSQLHLLHLQQPLWLLALIPLALTLWLFSRSRPSDSAWAKVIDPKLLPYLLQGEETKTATWSKWLLGIAGVIAIVALADPVWEKVARPVFQTNAARVIVLDLSNSMLVDDLKPNRLARARFKIEDILSREEEGQTGLVVFAGDAFTASPLTRDVDTIRNLLNVFTPQIMPAQGSRVDYGLQKAHELLKQAGVKNGQVLLIADGVSNPKAAYKAAEALRKDGHRVSVLAVGTEKGGMLRFRTKRVNVKLDSAALQKISKKGGGGYHSITSNNADLNAVLLKTLSNDKKNQAKTDDFKSADWKSTGPLLLFLILPMAALAFRKGWLLNLFLVVGLSAVIAQPQAVYADAPATTNSANESSGFIAKLNKQWDKLWLNAEQRADRALKQKQYQQASQLSHTPLRKGSASYKGKDYKAALNAFKKAQGADALYNQGNALAKLGKYKEAIDAYKKALQAKPDMKDAKINKKAIEDFLKRKKQQQKKQQQKQQQNKNDKNKDKKDQKNQKNKNKQNDKQQKDKKSGKDGKSKDDAQGKKQNQKNNQDKNGQKGNKKDKDKNQFDKANKALKNKDKNQKQADQEEQQQQAKLEQQKEQQKSAKDKADKDKQSKKGKQKKQQTKAEKAQKDKQTEAQKAAKAKAEELSKEEKMAAEQWLRRIPDDPGGLLRRKFRRQYQRSNRRPNNDEQPW